MNTIVKSLFALLVAISLQVITYVVFLHPYVSSWGATEKETEMSLPGDELAVNISSTRAITINSPKTDVWQRIIQLGADRGGFYSYSFIENLLGYKSREPKNPDNRRYKMNVGRVVRGSLDESKSAIKYNFPVVAVEPGQYFVLENWGSFYLKELDENKTRLIVRTHEPPINDISSTIKDIIGMGFHYLMERRMLIGFKAIIETGENPSGTSDTLWLLGIFLSMVVIILHLLLSRNRTNRLIATILSLLWLFPLLILKPTPFYSMGFLLIVLVYLYSNIKRRQDRLI